MGEVTCGGSPHLSRKPDQIKMRHYLDRRVTPPKRVSSPNWGPPPQRKQALSHVSAFSVMESPRELYSCIILCPCSLENNAFSVLH